MANIWLYLLGILLGCILGYNVRHIVQFLRKPKIVKNSTKTVKAAGTIVALEQFKKEPVSDKELVQFKKELEPEQIKKPIGFFK